MDTPRQRLLTGYFFVKLLNGEQVELPEKCRDCSRYNDASEGINDNKYACYKLNLFQNSLSTTRTGKECPKEIQLRNMRIGVTEQRTLKQRLIAACSSILEGH